MRASCLLLVSLTAVVSEVMITPSVPAQSLPSYVQGEVRQSRIFIDPVQGPPRTVIRVRAAGFRPLRSVTVLAGRGPGNLSTYGSARVDESGRVRTRVQVPVWVRPGGTFMVAVVSPGGRSRAISEPFRVTGLAGGGGAGGERVEVTGVIRQGAECPIIRTDHGEVYSLVGDMQEFGAGDHVRIVGRTVEVSICTRGTTVQIRRIEEDQD